MSTIRIGGLASGLDTNSIIDQLMAVERQPETLMQHNQQILKWKSGFWGEINTKLLAVRTSAASLMTRSTMMAMTATSGDDTHVGASADSTAAAGIYTVNVTSLATSTVYKSGVGALSFGIGGKADPTQAVNSDLAKLGTKITSGTFTINGKQITINDGDYLGTGNQTDSKDILGKINASGAGVTAAYDTANDVITLTANAAGGNLNLGSVGDTSNFLTATDLLTAGRVGDVKTSTVHLGAINPNVDLNVANFSIAGGITDGGSGTGQFTINGVQINWSASADTLNSIITRINNSTANVQASYDALSDQLVLRAKSTGSLDITMADNTGNFLQAVNLTGAPAAGGASQVTFGDNAVFTIDGVNNNNPIVRTSNSVSDVVSGVTFNLKAKTTTAVNITVGKDVSTAENAVKDFISKFNDALSWIDEKMSETTVTKKKWADMTDTERQQGIMRGDTVLNSMREQLVSIVTNMAGQTTDGYPQDLNALSQIGIQTTVAIGDGADQSGNGTLKLDTTKFEAALQNRPDQVMQLFWQDSNNNGQVDKDANGVPTEKGLIAQLDYYLQTLTDTRTQLFGTASAKMGSVPRQQDVLASQVSDLQNQIDAFEARMTQREDNLVAQFTAMEQMYSQSQTTSTWLTSQISKLG